MTVCAFQFQQKQSSDYKADWYYCSFFVTAYMLCVNTALFPSHTLPLSQQFCATRLQCAGVGGQGALLGVISSYQYQRTFFVPFS